MEITSTQKYISGTPRKLRLVVDMVRKMQPLAALEILEFTQKRAAGDISRALKTALANARQQGLDTEKMFLKKIEVNEGPRIKRQRAGTRGRGKPYKRRMSHVRIVLTDEVKLNKQSVLEQKKVVKLDDLKSRVKKGAK